jgi:hypothetical protein
MTMTHGLRRASPMKLLAVTTICQGRSLALCVISLPSERK